MITGFALLFIAIITETLSSPFFYIGFFTGLMFWKVIEFTLSEKKVI